jgi:hypothetical protein
VFKTFTLSLVLLFSITVVSAQSWEVGGFIGRSGYMGDLNPAKPYAFNNYAFGAQVKRNFDGYFSLKLNYVHGKIQAADSLSDNEQHRNRNLSFFSPLDEIALHLEFNFFNYIPSLSKKRFSPYLFTGIGATIFNPQTNYKGSTYRLNQYGTEGQELPDTYKLLALSIPYGAGIKYNITGKWNLIGEVGYRTANTDYLDDVSNKYPAYIGSPTPDQLTLLRQNLSDPSKSRIGVSDTQRGDFRKKDTYMFFGVSLTYTFLSQKCYLF